MEKAIYNPTFTENEESNLLTDENLFNSLIVWNDDVNTFDWVIKTLITICGHSKEQAEQCAYVIHTRGKYAVKTGDFEILNPMCNSICERGINATIESFGNE